jgi:adenylate cyclase
MAEAHPGRVGRRLAAIVAADVAGYSRLMGLDEVGTARTLREHRAVTDPLVARHGGRIVKTTGDGVLLEFPSVVDAVECAVAVQAVMDQRNEGVPVDRRMLFRIGINLGDILIEGDDILGDGVNIAARLEGIAEAGGICISSTAYDQVQGKVAVEFADLGDQRLKNIARPIRAFVVRAKGEAPTPSKATTLLLPDKPSIAVLPFQNMSGDPDQEYFADGMVEDIITELSRFKSLFVIARNSSFTYKGKPVDIKQVGRELGVRYVLEGSVRKAGNRVRITGQLIEAVTNNHLWADKFDGAIEDIFSLQDQITTAVVVSIAPAVQRAEIERARRKPTDRLDSYDLYLRGAALLRTGALDEARTYFFKAIENDPEYGVAYAMLALTFSYQQATSGLTLSAEERFDAIRFANAAAKLAADDAFSLAVAGHVLTYIGRSYDRGSSMIADAVALNPNLARAWHSQGWVALMCDEPERAIEAFERLLRLSPLDPLRPWALNGTAFALFCLGRYLEGCDAATKSVQFRADAHSLGALIINSNCAERIDETKEAVAHLLQLQPKFRASDSVEAFPIRSAVTRDRILKALEAAGLPP